MKNNILNLNEEIRRIKSLFTEERMFGNLVEDVGVTSDTKDNQAVTTNVPEGSVELTDAKKKEIEGDVEDSLDFYETEEIDGKTYIKRMLFVDIKPMLGVIDRPKPGRDMYYTKRKIKDDNGVGVEMYISKEAELKYMTKKESKDIRKNIKQDVKGDKGAISDNIDSCKTHLKKMYKAWLEGAGPGDLEQYGFSKEEGENAYLTVERCMANFYNKFEPNEKIMTMVTAFKNKKLIGNYRTGEESVAKGVEGQKYDVKDTRGNVIAKIIKITGNKYEFKNATYTAMQKKQNPETNEIVYSFRPSTLDAVYRTLNLKPSQYDIIITKANDKLTNCLFRVEPK